MQDDVYAVILVGGKGKRLRPLSTDEKPKAFLSITRDMKSMFRRTADRIEPLVGAGNIFVVANEMHAKHVMRDFPSIKRSNLILEPISRNTAPAVGLASRIIAARNKDAIIAVLPTDHYIRDEKRQLRVVGSAIEFIRRRRDAIVVFGINPTFPCTEYGYIKVRGPASGRLRTRRPGIRGVVKVERFVEKPDLRTARKYIESGKYLWNSGAFLFTARTILKAIEKYEPAIHRGLKDLGRITSSYARMPDLSLDYAVMERSPDIYCVTGSYGWNDVGSFAALKKVLKRESRRFVEEDGKIVKII